MGQPEKDGLERTLAGTFQCQMQLSQQRQIIITGHIYSDDEPADVNARLDAYQDALDRQYVRVDLVNAQAQREALLAHIEQHRGQLEELKAKQDAVVGSADRKKRLSSQEQQILQTGEATLRAQVKGVESLDAKIAAAKKKLGMDV